MPKDSRLGSQSTYDNESPRARPLRLRSGQVRATDAANLFVAEGFDGVEVRSAHGGDHAADYADDSED